MRRRRILVTAAWIAGILILLASFVVPVQRSMTWIDAVTGSSKHQTYVTFGFEMKPMFKTVPVIEASPLADWLVHREGRDAYRWCHVEGTLKTFWGASTGFGHGRAPPIYFLPGALLEQFVKSSTDAELGHFVDVMRHGTEEEARAAVKAAGEKAMAAMDAGARDH